MIEVRHYLTPTGEDVIEEWLTNLKDVRADAKIELRIACLAAGNFGDCKSLGKGLYELRIDSGPGYRIYYALVGSTCVLLLCAGAKRKQSSDILRARAMFTDFKKRA